MNKPSSSTIRAHCRLSVSGLPPIGGMGLAISLFLAGVLLGCTNTGGDLVSRASRGLPSIHHDTAQSGELSLSTDGSVVTLTHRISGARLGEHALLTEPLCVPYRVVSPYAEEWGTLGVGEPHCFTARDLVAIWVYEPVEHVPMDGRYGYHAIFLVGQQGSKEYFFPKSSIALVVTAENKRLFLVRESLWFRWHEHALESTPPALLYEVHEGELRIANAKYPNLSAALSWEKEMRAVTSAELGDHIRDSIVNDTLAQPLHNGLMETMAKAILALLYSGNITCAEWLFFSTRERVLEDDKIVADALWAELLGRMKKSYAWDSLTLIFPDILTLQP